MPVAAGDDAGHAHPGARQLFGRPARTRTRRGRGRRTPPGSVMPKKPMLAHLRQRARRASRPAPGRARWRAGSTSFMANWRARSRHLRGGRRWSGHERERRGRDRQQIHAGSVGCRMIACQPASIVCTVAPPTSTASRGDHERPRPCDVPARRQGQQVRGLHGRAGAHAPLGPHASPPATTRCSPRRCATGTRCT